MLINLYHLGSLFNLIGIMVLTLNALDELLFKQFIHCVENHLQSRLVMFNYSFGDHNKKDF